MRKIKKINGFLVVKFNDREKREYEGTALGEYGVIDAEVYTGNLDIDRGAMEYDAEFGWGLYDFIQSEDTELTRLEITQRVRLKLQKREVILPESIEISIAFEDDAVVLHCSFRFAEEDERRELDVIIGAVSVEVVSE